jgi:hypothetical protein
VPEYEDTRGLLHRFWLAREQPAPRNVPRVQRAEFFSFALDPQFVRALGRSRLSSDGVAFDLSELPPSQRKPIPAHESVDGRPAAANGHLRADLIGLTGDAHHWDEEGHDAKSTLHRDVVGHRFGGDRIESAPGAASACSSHYIRNGA